MVVGLTFTWQRRSGARLATETSGGDAARQGGPPGGARLA
jgi:hypothetical protein